MLVGNLTRGSIRPLLPSLFPVKKAVSGSEYLVAQNRQLPWPGWKTLPSKVRATAQTLNLIRRFRCGDNNVICKHLKPHCYLERQVEPCHRLGEVAMLCLNNNCAPVARTGQHLWLQLGWIGYGSNTKLSPPFPSVVSTCNLTTIALGAMPSKI